jgi:hypothetical protein
LSPAASPRRLLGGQLVLGADGGLRDREQFVGRTVLTGVVVAGDLDSLRSRGRVGVVGLRDVSSGSPRFPAGTRVSLDDNIVPSLVRERGVTVSTRSASVGCDASG